MCYIVLTILIVPHFPNDGKGYCHILARFRPKMNGYHIIKVTKSRDFRKRAADKYRV